MPRHPLGETAMTDAERQQKRRERLRQERDAARDAASLSDRQKLAEAQQEIERLRKELAAASKPAPATDFERGRLIMENTRLKMKLDDARKDEPEQIAQLRRHINRLQAEHARRDAAAKAAKTKATKLAEGGDDARIAQLQKANSDLRKRLNRMRAHHDEQSRNKGIMTFKAASLIAKALHPDATPDDKVREEAFKAFSAWKSDNKNAARRR
jgi:chromosome segregation ATPase